MNFTLWLDNLWARWFRKPRWDDFTFDHFVWDDELGERDRT